MFESYTHPSNADVPPTDERDWTHGKEGHEGNVYGTYAWRACVQTGAAPKLGMGAAPRRVRHAAEAHGERHSYREGHRHGWPAWLTYACQKAQSPPCTFPPALQIEHNRSLSLRNFSTLEVSEAKHDVSSADNRLGVSACRSIGGVQLVPATRTPDTRTADEGMRAIYQSMLIEEVN